MRCPNKVTSLFCALHPIQNSHRSSTSHACCAMQVGDLPSFNQCAVKLQALHASAHGSAHGSVDEFLGYHILHALIHKVTIVAEHLAAYSTWAHVILWLCVSRLVRPSFLAPCLHAKDAATLAATLQSFGYPFAAPVSSMAAGSGNLKTGTSSRRAASESLASSPTSPVPSWLVRQLFSTTPITGYRDAAYVSSTAMVSEDAACAGESTKKSKKAKKKAKKHEARAAVSSSSLPSGGRSGSWAAAPGLVAVTVVARGGRSAARGDAGGRGADRATGRAVAHALGVVKAVRGGDYATFFRLYRRG